MTCIVGITDGRKVIIGGDSAGVAGLDLRIRKDPKVFVNGDFVFGCTTSFRMIQLLQYKLQAPKRHPETDAMAFMATEFIDVVRQTLKDGGFSSRKNETETGGTFLVGYAGRLFRVEEDYQVGEVDDGFDACGCGESYARGALYASKFDESTSRDRIEKALECAAHFSAGVVAPFVFLQGGAA